jgi:DNA invertase Pin-like site-specific DNA recombinase
MTEAPKVYSYVRFSSPEQKKGDSFDRQLQAAKKYAECAGLVLDDSLSMRDEGLSGFKGDHIKKGALGRFLKLVEDGSIMVGSTLLVESIDRLSREAVMDAFNLFSGILGRGIKIVVLGHGRERSYTKKLINENPGQLHELIGEMQRAHEESAWKRDRLSKAWESKRKKAKEGRILTSRGPAWLRLSKDRKNWEKIEERCETVRLIFELKADGIGNGSIVRELNASALWKKDWRESYIQKLVHDRRVLGEYQPHKMVNGKRAPTGEPIPDYFPPIVSEELFYKVQEQLARMGVKGGRNGAISNLFGHLAKCGYCGSAMRLVNKGKPPKGGKYLVCDQAQRGRGCKRLAVRYEQIETSILENCRHLHPSDLLSRESEHESKIRKAKMEYDGLSGKITEIDRQIDNLRAGYAEAADSEVRTTLHEDLSKKLKQKRELESKHDKLENELMKLKSAVESGEKRLSDVRELLDRIEGRDADVIALRQRLRAHLRDLIDKIKVYPVGMPFLRGGTLESFLESRADAKYRNGAVASVFFKGGGFVVLMPFGQGISFEEDEDGNLYWYDQDGRVDDLESADFDPEEIERLRELARTKRRKRTEKIKDVKVAKSAA